MAFLLSFYLNLILTITIIFELIPILIIATTNINSKNNNKINLLDQNAFQMNFGKRKLNNNEIINNKWPKMDGNSFKISFGKRLVVDNNNGNGGNEEEILTHSNIAIPLLFDLSGEPELLSSSSILNKSFENLKQPNFNQKQNWPSRWRANLFKKRLDRNLFNIGFGK